MLITVFINISIIIIITFRSKNLKESIRIFAATKDSPFVILASMEKDDPIVC